MPKLTSQRQAQKYSPQRHAHTLPLNAKNLVSKDIKRNIALKRKKRHLARRYRHLALKSRKSIFALRQNEKYSPQRQTETPKPQTEKVSSQRQEEQCIPRLQAALHIFFMKIKVCYLPVWFSLFVVKLRRLFIPQTIQRKQTFPCTYSMIS